MLGTAKTYTLRAERSRLLSVVGSIRVGSHAQSLVFVSQIHNSAEVARVGVCGNGRDKAVVNVTRRAVKRNAVAFLEHLARKGKLLVFFVHLNVAAAGNAAGSHTARNYRRVRSLSAAYGKNTLRVLHTFDIFGGSFKTD